jgi:hypothetical protein
MGWRGPLQLCNTLLQIASDLKLLCNACHARLPHRECNLIEARLTNLKEES